uniref:Uncharacterized protein n=1 Tax=Oncorhynchus kisutch TaxID=8019 RepID=A0A8C7HW70_ONCKI
MCMRKGIQVCMRKGIQVCMRKGIQVCMRKGIQVCMRKGTQVCMRKGTQVHTCYKAPFAGSNSRPISLLPVLIKLMETIVFDQIQCHFQRTS